MLLMTRLRSARARIKSWLFVLMLAEGVLSFLPLDGAEEL